MFAQGPPDVEGRFPTIEIRDGPDEGSDSSLKAKGDAAQKDVTPLLEGRTLLAFRDLGESSSSVNLEMDEIGKLLKGGDQSPGSDGAGELDETFKDVK